MDLEPLFNLLQDTPGGSFFNPWFDRDREHDRTPEAPEIRRKQLQAYLQERENTAKYLCIGEALGYQGGHFTGIAMTSERILLGYHEEMYGISPEGVFQSVEPERTSKLEVNPKGMTEPTATIMWKALYQMQVDPYEVVLWNALSWHPYDPERGMLSNRTPTDGELEEGYEALQRFLECFPDCEVISVGKKCAKCLDALGVGYKEVRHPANGGAVKFRNQFKEIINAYFQG